MSRKTWVQHPVTHKMVPLEEVNWDRTRTTPRRGGPQIMSDLEPFVSPVDGSVITSRSRLREHNARNDVVNIREFDGVFEEAAATRKAIAENTHKPTKQDRIRDVVKAYNTVMEKK